MEEGKRLRRMLAGLTALLCLAVGLCGALHLREAELRREIAMQQQREMADVIAAMADIEVNLSKLLVASGARQSVSLLGETAILAQHVESGLSRLTAGERATGDAMKFAGQMGQYSLALAALNAWRQAGGRLRYTLCAEAAEGEKAQGEGKKKLQTEEMRGIIHW